MEKTRFLISVYVFILSVVFSLNLFAQETQDNISDSSKKTVQVLGCIKDADCVATDAGLEGRCVTSKDAANKCEFSPKIKVSVTVIGDKDCRTCNVTLFLNKLQLALGDVDVKLTEFDKAQDLINKTGLKMLPIYILSNNVKDHKNFKLIEKNLTLIDAGYVVNPNFSGAAYFLDRKPIKGSLDLFISPFAKGLAAILNNLKNLKPNVHFLAVKNENGFETQYGEFELEEELRGVCVQRYYPSQFMDYLSCRAQNSGSSWWDNCLKKGNSDKIKKCAIGDEGKALLSDNIKLNEELKVMYGPAVLLDNREIFIATPEMTEKDLKTLQKNTK